MSGIKKILIGFLVVLLGLQLLQYFTDMIPEQSLHGAYQEYPVPKLSLQSWHSWDFQANLTHHMDRNFGFRPFFIKLNNQMYYSLFRQATSGGLVIGKENHIFELNYIESYYGRDYQGQSKIDSSIIKLDSVISFLRKWDTELFIVITPNKVKYFNEYLPDHYVFNKSRSNYQAYMEHFAKGKYQVVDANSWFQKLKLDSPYPMMTRVGTHWSVYGAAYFADSLFAYMEDRLDTALNQFEIDQVEYPLLPEGSDKDLADLLNVFTPICEQEYAYPRTFHYYPNNSGYKPNLIAIGDSFFWSMFKDFFVASFNESWFWYYFSSIYPDYTGANQKTNELDVLEKMMNTDIVLIVTSTDNLEDLGFGMVDYVYDFMMMNKHEKFNHLVPRYVQSINKNPELLESVKLKAQQQQISIDSMIYMDACWLVEKRLDWLEQNK